MIGKQCRNHQKNNRISFKDDMFKNISLAMQSAPLEPKPIRTPAHISARLSGASSFQFRRNSSSSESSNQPRHLQSASKAIASIMEVDAPFESSNFDCLAPISASNSADILSISPIFGKPFDAQSLNDESMAATEESLIRGIRNINYDISFCESPTENSLVEEIRKYSAVTNTAVVENSVGGISISKSDLEEFDPLHKKEISNSTTKCLIDESPNDLLLDDPLLPIRNDYRGVMIPSISCETGQSPGNSQK